MTDDTRDRAVDVIVDSDERVGGGGFLEIRRLRLRNRRADGSASAPYVCDAIARPYGQDAVVVAVYARRAGAAKRRPPYNDPGSGRSDDPSSGRSNDPTGGVDVLVREGLRPALRFGREAERAPLPEEPCGLYLTELVAGIIEDGDRGEEGLRVRAAHEVHEEAGFVVDPASIVLLGAGMLPSPGSMVEKFYFVAVEVDPAAQGPLAGDGSPMEEGARTRWLPLDAALAACWRGDLADLKTELGLRRLRDHLQGH